MQRPPTVYWPVLVAALIGMFTLLPLFAYLSDAASGGSARLVPGVGLLALFGFAICGGLLWLQYSINHKRQAEFENAWHTEQRIQALERGEAPAKAQPIFYKPQQTPQQQAQAGQEYQAMLDARRNARGK